MEETVEPIQAFLCAVHAISFVYPRLGQFLINMMIPQWIRIYHYYDFTLMTSSQRLDCPLNHVGPIMRLGRLHYSSLNCERIC